MVNFFQALDDFHLLRVLGKGTFSKVILAKIKKTGEVVALKILKKEIIVAKVSKHTLIQQLTSKMEWQSLLKVSVRDVRCGHKNYIQFKSKFHPTG